ncbi:hypothetical protein [Halalkalicoccus ordinarius]|uniref:hypothetical protein n=1 Tax=Halalkalicoccus ordinarius TaxID=3116651 RepID=UPI00300F6121
MNGMQSKSPYFDPGDLVTDRENDTEDENDDPRMLVVDVTDDHADDVEVSQTGSTVADYNPTYPADDPVISIVFVENEHELGLWQKDADLKAGRNPDTPFGELIADAVPDDRRRYSYPQSRLREAEYHAKDDEE